MATLLKLSKKCGFRKGSICLKILEWKPKQSMSKEKGCPVQVFVILQNSSGLISSVVSNICWSIQRVFEKGETRYYDYVSNKISVVWDLYDFAGAVSGKNYYSKNRKLTEENCINEKSPKMH
jgi:hypothetical protein